MIGLIKAWLKCGVMEEGHVRHSTTGTPQGGCISPLLSNVFLHAFDKMWQLYGPKGTKLVRYADDFVILCRHSGREVLKRVRQFLSRLRLTLNEEKTHVVRVEEGSSRCLDMSCSAHVEVGWYRLWTVGRLASLLFFLSPA